MQHALIALLVLLSGLRYPQQTMNARGERILIFGDSLTQHASGSQPVWNVDQGSQRQASGPGDLLASLLLEQGATVRTNALVSRSAINFWTREAAQNLIAADLAWRPTKIIFVLGTNDVGLAPGADEAAFIRLRDAYAPAKAEIWAIGPFKSRLAAADVGRTAAIMGRVFGRRFIDGRQLSALISNGPDGVHYEPTGARLLALNMADALLSASTVKPWVGLAIGLGVVIGGGMIYSAWKRPGGLTGLGAENPYSTTASSERLRKLDLTKPRPLNKLYRNPTPEQTVEHKAALAAWSSARRKALAEHKRLVEASNAWLASNRNQGLGAEYMPPGTYRLIYLTAGKRSVLPDAFPSIEAATRAMRALKARGLTVWVEDDAGAFVPVKGAQRKPRELGSADDASFDAAKAERALIENEVRAAGQVLRAFPRGSTGLVPDAVKETAEYKAANTRYQRAFARQRAFNAMFIKKFAVELKTERDRRRGLKGLGAEYLPPGAYFLVDNAARAVPERERFGQRKVFISDVHAQLRRTGVDISPDDLKRELIRMHRDRNVHLARADLVAAMDPAKVAASEARDGNATFHFVVIE